MKYREVARKLTALGCQERKRRGGGSHRKWFNPNSQQGTVVPDWGGRDLRLGRRIIDTRRGIVGRRNTLFLRRDGFREFRSGGVLPEFLGQQTRLC
jgi:mRNA interferase HicA